MSPIWTSGSANTVFGASLATRYAHASAASSPPPRHAPLTAATTGVRSFSRRSSSACPSRLIASACDAVSISRNSSMSAPATHTSGFPLRTTAARIAWSRSRRSSKDANSSRTERANVFTGAPGTSSVMTAMPSRMSVVRAVLMGKRSLALHDHRKPHPAGGTYGHEPELATTTPELIQQRGRYAGAGRAERMADRDRAAHDVQPGPVDFAYRLRKSGALRPFLRLEAAQIREHLSRKSLVHLDEIHVAERQA